MAASVIVCGPQRCGKTRSAEALRRHFGLVDVRDDWNGRDPIPLAGTLVLTNAPVDCHLAAGVRVVDYSEAIAAINRPSKYQGQRDAFGGLHGATAE